ncbi:hypothetical protein [Pedobacter sp. SYSU D00535]|uniref:hypothetical protein n=1 Tax=Pedobacter sp. SYSU D00535 TaxID=2810308 RepID=UPI001A96FC69|nr:hypothetical protein [Pedobacter sp. SYSU D00535]
MKAPLIYRLILGSMMLALPFGGVAKELGFKNELIEDSGALREFQSDQSFQEEPRQEDPKQEKKPKKGESTPSDDRKPDSRKPEVKEVPKSRRLPKPTAVTDRVKVKRPPVKVQRPKLIKRH